MWRIGLRVERAALMNSELRAVKLLAEVEQVLGEATLRALDLLLAEMEENARRSREEGKAA